MPNVDPGIQTVVFIQTQSATETSPPPPPPSPTPAPNPTQPKPADKPPDPVSDAASGHGYVPHPKQPELSSDAASGGGYDYTHYYTYPWQVHLGPNQTLAFKRGRGYYAASEATPRQSGGSPQPTDTQPTQANPAPSPHDPLPKVPMEVESPRHQKVMSPKRGLLGDIGPVHIVKRSGEHTKRLTFRFTGVSLEGGGQDPLDPWITDPVVPVLTNARIKARLVGEVAETSTGLVGIHVAFSDLDTTGVPDDDEIVVGFKMQITDTKTGKTHWENVPVPDLGEVHPGWQNGQVENVYGYVPIDLGPHERVSAVEGSFAVLSDHVPLHAVFGQVTVKLPPLSPSKY